MPANWLGATLLLLAALALVTRGGPGGRDRLCRYAAGAFAVAASAAVVQLGVDSGSGIAGAVVNRRLLVLVVVGLAIAAATVRQAAGRDRLIAALAVAVAGSACLMQPGSLALHMTGGIVALALYWTSCAPSANERMGRLHPAGLPYRRPGETPAGGSAQRTGRGRAAAS